MLTCMLLEDIVQDFAHYVMYQKQLNTIWSNTAMQQNTNYNNYAKNPTNIHLGHDTLDIILTRCSVHDAGAAYVTVKN